MKQKITEEDIIKWANEGMKQKIDRGWRLIFLIPIAVIVLWLIAFAHLC
jgi:hypothetical protein